jgi:TetR/AcrR family transcriptional regulator
MVGDALVFENERLQARMMQLFDKIEASFKQLLREAHSAASASATPTVDAQIKASMLTALLMGRLQRFTRSGFKKMPTEQMDATLGLIL